MVAKPVVDNGWHETTIGAQATLQRGFDITKASQRPGTFPVVSSGGPSSFHDTAAVRGPGVVLGRKGTVGTVFYIPGDFWPHDTTLWVKDFHGNDPRFVYYFFLAMRDELAALDVGTANPALNRNHVHPIVVRWPSVEEQRAIASVLGALDDKIELNRQMNRTLEAMAQALFKSWFVDFDPVVAKGAGRQPFGMDAETASLFPRSFIDSELGAMPKGWSTTTVYDCGSFLNGLAFRGEHFSPDKSGLPVIRIAELKYGISSQTNFTTRDFEPDYRVNDGDTLFSWSGSPETSIDTFIWTGGVGWLNQHIFKVTPRPPLGRSFIFALLKYFNDTFIEIARNKQTTGLGHVTVRDLKELQLAVAPAAIVAHFSAITEPLLQRLVLNSLESARLTGIRDTLLPMLVSGEIRLREAESLAEHAPV